MRDPDEFISDFLSHVLSDERTNYDPVKAHEYYMRTRKLKGRKKRSWQDRLNDARKKAQHLPSDAKDAAEKKLDALERKISDTVHPEKKLNRENAAKGRSGFFPDKGTNQTSPATNRSDRLTRMDNETKRKHPGIFNPNARLDPSQVQDRRPQGAAERKYWEKQKEIDRISSMLQRVHDQQRKTSKYNVVKHYKLSHLEEKLRKEFRKQREAQRKAEEEYQRASR